MIRLENKVKFLDCFNNKPVFAKKDSKVDLHTEVCSVRCGLKAIEDGDGTGVGLMVSIVALSLNHCYPRYCNLRARLFK
jgi:hypothetical protein